ncbi:hypothetical protein C8R46DRAFT_550709 [Mycena filopes]|nr:hypothetical protein C8R46DRAFT_550709 [Mycena filopes]
MGPAPSRLTVATFLDLDTMPIWIVVHCQLVPVHHRRDPLRISNILSFSQLDVSSFVGTANPSTHPSISSMSFRVAARRYHDIPHTELRTDRIPALIPTVSLHWQLRALVLFFTRRAPNPRLSSIFSCRYLTSVLPRRATALGSSTAALSNVQ